MNNNQESTIEYKVKDQAFWEGVINLFEEDGAKYDLGYERLRIKYGRTDPIRLKPLENDRRVDDFQQEVEERINTVKIDEYNYRNGKTIRNTSKHALLVQNDYKVREVDVEIKLKDRIYHIRFKDDVLTFRNGIDSAPNTEGKSIRHSAIKKYLDNNRYLERINQ